MRYQFEISGYDLLFGASICIGTTFSLLLLIVKRKNQIANRMLGLILLTIVLWMTWALAIDINLSRYFQFWSWIPLQYSLTIGPLLYCYVRKLTLPQIELEARDLLLFLPLLAEQGVHVCQILESSRLHIPTYNTTVFAQYNPILQVLSIISVLLYLKRCLQMLRAFDDALVHEQSDIYRYHSKWLQRLLIGFGLLWLAWIPFIAVDYFAYNYQLPVTSYYPLYLLLASMTIWIGLEAFLRPELIIIELKLTKQFVSLTEEDTNELYRDGEWLRKEMETKLYYLDSGLTLASLAEALIITPHELSRIINQGVGKNFNDFINEYRVNDVIQKIQNSSFARLTLLGIAYESGFNSKSTFNRTFKQFTHQTPAEYRKNQQKSAQLIS